MSLKKAATALSSSKLGNQAPKKIKVDHEDNTVFDDNPVDMLLAKLSEQQAEINKQHNALKAEDEIPTHTRILEYISASATSNSPANADVVDCPTSTAGPSLSVNESQATAEDVLRLKLELQLARGKIARMDQELAQNRITKHTIDQAIGSMSDTDFQMTQSDISRRSLTPVHPSLDATIRSQINPNTWATQDDVHSDVSDALSAGGFNRSRAVWANAGRQHLKATTAPFQQPGMASSCPWMGREYGTQFCDPSSPFIDQNTNPPFRNDRMATPDFLAQPAIGRRNNMSSRLGDRNGAAYSYAGNAGRYDNLAASTTYTPGNIGVGLSSLGGPIPNHINMAMNVAGGSFSGYQPQPIGTPLSPHAPEFTSSAGSYKTDAAATEGQTYLPPTEPLNYRRLLDRTVTCNWKYIVDKIVCNNDQQASIFLQQKLKIGTVDQKYDIVEAIIAQAYPLMINRFGNFLVQRCFEHGTPEQVIKIAEAIRGNTLNLSMDAFGCHVIQKAFDSVPENYKAIMVHELLRRIPETVIHRYACHVWQKLFELRWTESPPQIMKYVNEALRGMWHEVALGETGSLVVQNIFENCLEEDKRPCIEEVLVSIDIVAHGQFGNWCIQHICEHGAPADRSRAIDHVIRYAAECSMDQFASKVVEKCLKIGGAEFLGRYLDRVCEGRPDRPRIPLIDIASDQYGNYLIQYILTHSNLQHREIVASHMRKHMVSLRGSKFGSRVGMLCTNLAVQTRPGPPGGAGGNGNGRTGQHSRYGQYR
ncbi:armadillo-type protein [Xylogone sp. PMI_703]|nr:armadillo-type protein [Xylogone sp. PMI_703]